MNDTGRKEAWRQAHEATLQICRMASCSPEDERYELAAELVGAAQSLVMALASEVDTDHVVDAASGSLANSRSDDTSWAIVSLARRDWAIDCHFVSRPRLIRSACA